MFQNIDMDTWERRATFENFMKLDCSYAITKTFDVTEFCAWIKQRHLKFFPAFVWL